jgi:ADP-ribosyl-[dinitrogen reductase] hydrolase
MTSVDKFRGAMLGLAVGDALGAPLQGLKAGHIKDVFNTVRGYVDPEPAFPNKPYRYRVPGVYTDNTQQALCLAESLVRCYGFQVEDFARTLLRLWQADPELHSGAFRGINANFKKVMDRLAADIDLKKIGEPDAGVNAGSHAAPVGLYFCEDREELIKASLDQALLTQKDPRGLALSAAVAFATGRGVIEWGSFKREERVDDLVDFAAESEKIIQDQYIAWLPPMVFDFFGLFYRSVEPFRHWQGMEQELVFRQIINLANQAFPREKINSPGQDFSLAAGVTALFLGTVSKDFESGVTTAVNLGRETDSLGAMVGAMLGARFGEESIPREWRAGLKNNEQVALRAEALFQKDSSGLKLKNLKDMELELTRFEILEREKFIQKMIKRGEFDPEAAARKQEAKRREEEKAKLAAKPRGKSKKDKRRREKTPWRNWQD